MRTTNYSRYIVKLIAEMKRNGEAVIYKDDEIYQKIYSKDNATDIDNIDPDDVACKSGWYYKSFGQSGRYISQEGFTWYEFYQNEEDYEAEENGSCLYIEGNHRR